MGEAVLPGPHPDLPRQHLCADDPGPGPSPPLPDQRGRSDITLIITGGLRTPADFIKALCLGADGIAVANAAIQAIGCVAARICNTKTAPRESPPRRKNFGQGCTSRNLPPGCADSSPHRWN